MKKILPIIVFSIILAQGYGQSFVNSSLEFWSSATVCETNTPPDGWTDYSNVGIGPDEGNLTLCPSTIPPTAANGNIYARCLAGNPNTCEGMYQFINGLTIGTTYTISYEYCGSNRWGGSGDCVWHLFIDDIDVNQSAIFSSADTVWHTNHYTFIASAVSHKIGVRAYTPTYNGGGSAAIDLFGFEQSKPTGVQSDLLAGEISVYPNPFTNSLTIKSNGSLAMTFTLTDLVGQLVFRKEFVNQTTIDTEALPQGIYLYEIRNENLVIKKSKLIKH
jgi:hypothetical protein